MSVIQSVEELVAVLREPTGHSIRKRVGVGKHRHYENFPQVRQIYLCRGGGWAITYQGGELPESILRDAIERGVVVDAFAGKFPGATPGVGYELSQEASHD